MSGYGTKKRGADLAEQLTFPAVFSEAVAQRQNPYGYLPQQQRNPVVMPVGDDLQDKYHAQKKLDADRRVMNAVMDNRASTARFLKSHQNYDLPRPVLSQRQFANPSLGNQSDIYSHRPIDWNQSSLSPLQGGVLFTQEAQKWGRQKLADRIPQLDAITLAKQAFLTGVPLGAVDRGAPLEDFPVGSKVELVALLQTIQSSATVGKINALTVADSVKFLRLLFRWATTATSEDLTDVYNYIEGDPDGIIYLLENIEEQFQEGVAEGSPVKPYNDQLLQTMRKVARYLEAMIKSVDRSPAERKKVSSNAIKNLGFTSLTQKSVERESQQLAENLRSSARQQNRQGDRYDYDRRGGDDDDITDIWDGNVRSDFSSEPREDMSRRSGQYSDDFSGVWSASDRSSSSGRSSAPSDRMSDMSGPSGPPSVVSDPYSSFSYAPSSVSQRSIPSSVSSANSFRSMRSAELPIQQVAQVAPSFVAEEKQEARPASSKSASASSSSGKMTKDDIRKAVNNPKQSAKGLHDKLVKQGILRSVLLTKTQGRKTTAPEYRQHIRDTLLR